MEISDIVSLISEEVAKQREAGIERIFELHIRAIACHCECLGMNAENCQRASLGQSMAYSDDSYLDALKKWGLVTEDFKPNI